MIVNSKGAVARAMGVYKSTVKNWILKGMPVREDGTYDVEEVKLWRTKTMCHRDKNAQVEQKVLALKENTGMSVSKIADTLGIGVTKVNNVLAKFEKYRGELDTWKAVKADYFAMEQLRYLDNITDKKLENTGARDLAAMAKIAWEKERVERGESTDNVAVIVQHIKGLKAKLKEDDARSQGR